MLETDTNKSAALPLQLLPVLPALFRNRLHQRQAFFFALDQNRLAVAAIRIQAGHAWVTIQSPSRAMVRAAI